MGWSIGYDTYWNRDIGYGVPAVCDYPNCNAEIDRGLAFVCGGEPYGGERGCGLYFCDQHRDAANSQCERCATDQNPFIAKADTKEWLEHKRTDPSWAQWRAERKAETLKELEGK